MTICQTNDATVAMYASISNTTRAVSLHAEDIRYIPVACGGAYPVINAAAGISGSGAANATLVSARLVKLA